MAATCLRSMNRRPCRICPTKILARSRSSGHDCSVLTGPQGRSISPRTRQSSGSRTSSVLGCAPMRRGRFDGRFHGFHAAARGGEFPGAAAIRCNPVRILAFRHGRRSTRSSTRPRSRWAKSARSRSYQSRTGATTEGAVQLVPDRRREYKLPVVPGIFPGMS